MDISTAELQWWLVAILLYGVGDYVTTLLSDQPGPVGFALLKGGALVVCFLGFLSISASPIAVGVPVGIALLGGVVTVSNTVMLVRTN